MTEGTEGIADGVKLKGYDDGFGKNAEDALKKTPIVGKGYDTVTNAFEKFGGAQDADDLATASGQLVSDGAGFVAGAAADLTSFVMDPVGWLVSNGLNMLIELIQPLQDALHFVTGDGPALKTASENFVSIGQGFVKLAEDFVRKGDEALKDWQGDAGKAAKDALGDFAVGIKGVGSSAGAVSETLKMWSMVMQVIEEVVKAIISELVSTLIYIWLPALAASVVSLGSSVAAAMATSVAKVTSAISKVTKYLGKFGKLLDDFMAFLGKWTDDLVKLSKTLTPGKTRAVEGAFAQATGTQGASTASGALGALGAAPGAAAKGAVGYDTAGTAGANAVGVADKTFDNIGDIDDAGEAGDLGGDQDAGDTRRNLDMDQ